VRLVDHHADVVAGGERDDVLQRRDVAVEREDRAGDDQRRAPVGVAQRPGEVLDVRVAVRDDLRAGQAAAVGERPGGRARGSRRWR
jgi:hypothetical protein